ncbi:MAG: M50 family metallopeptidase [Solirubrobacterales bacterium]
MASTNEGSIRLFRFAGITVFLHWSWFLVAYYQMNNRIGDYASSSFLWNALEYLALFAIVLLHEFGHSLACRQVGGRAERIVLWPLGGMAYVQPPQRPGAMLWSIAAGPLVNVVLAPVLYLVGLLMVNSGTAEAWPNGFGLLKAVMFINFGLLIFNILPIYPLDGGQIFRSLLWFVMGRAWSLTVATVVGFVGVAGLVLLAVVSKSVWLGVLSAFILFNSWRGLKHGLYLMRLAKIPRREGLACPACGAAPLAGAFWVCPRCRNPFDVFEAKGICPQCGETGTGGATSCVECGGVTPIGAWNPSTEPPISPAQTLPTSEPA